MVKQLFGATSSPSIANFCLHKTAELHGREFEADTVETVKRNMYMDDLMKSKSTKEEAIMLVSQLRELLARGGFRLTKWYSNEREVLATIPESERAKSVVNLDLEKLPTETALGLKWNTEEDKFVWEPLKKILQVANQRPMTRRGIVSAIYSLFDPLGFIAPYIMKAKLLLQTLSRKRLGWDDLIEATEKTQWNRWMTFPNWKKLKWTVVLGQENSLKSRRHNYISFLMHLAKGMCQLHTSILRIPATKFTARL